MLSKNTRAKQAKARTGSVRIPLMMLSSERSDAGRFMMPEVIGMVQG